MAEEINLVQIQEKWQKKWDESKTFEVDFNNKKKKFYILEMFPYPSGSGLHMGHALNYTIGDIYARLKIMQGYNVLHPMGYDSLGLPAENAAIKVGTHPKEYTEESIKNFIVQQKSLGITYDWSRTVITSTPEYYKWDQWIFLKMFEKGLAYKKKSPVNWCPECNTVLANEQVHEGKCWRHDNTNVEIKNLEQWYLKTTDYAEELNDFSKLDGWPDLIKKLQKNWIGKSHGTEVHFEINGEDWKVFTTRPDTLYGVTFLVISAQHSKLMNLVTDEQKEAVQEFVKKQHSVSEEEIDQLEKEGVFTGSYAIHPFTNEKVPVYAGNFVLAEYGSGMVMAVPTHDQRDFEFAKKYNIPMKIVITPEDKELKLEEMERAYVEDGVLINSDKFDGMNNREAIEKITQYLEEINKGKKTTNFRLRDWLISRQRYWGTPIPIINCKDCGEVPVPESQLPIELPHDVTFGDGNPLLTNKEFVHTECPKCGKEATRETDTMDTFVNSSWYNLRYADPKNNEKIFDSEKVDYWNPIDMYIGGKEHACMHLIYIRFYTKFLRDIGMLNFDEPALKLFNQGMLHAEDGNKMSKSLGNVVNPLDIVNRDGADPLRMFLVSVASPDSDFNWSEKGLQGSIRLVNKIIEYFEKVKIGDSTPKTESKLNQSIKLITEDLEKMKYNLAIIKIRELFESLNEEESKDTLETFIKILTPLCPHISEELWERIGNKGFVSLESFPIADETKINESFDIADKVFDNTTSDINQVLKLANLDKLNKIRLFVSLSWKYDLYDLLKEKLKETRNPKDIIPEVMNSDLKQYGQEIMKIIPKLLKTGTLPGYLEKEKELSLLNEAKESFEKEFGCEVEIIDADSSNEQKAKAAMPGKPAIIVE